MLDEILYTTSEFLGMQLIMVSLKRKEEIQIKVSLIFGFYYQCVFFKIFSPINAENCGTLSHNLKLQHIKK